MTDVVIINGPAGVGKTTIAQSLALSSPGTVCIHGDVIRHFSPPDARTHLGPGSTFRAGAALVTAYVEMNAPRVLFDYVFTDANQISRFCQGLHEEVSVFVVTLWAPLETVAHREASRPGREPLGAQVLETYRTLERNLNELGVIIENTQAPEDAVTDIINALKRTGGRPASRFVKTAD